MADDPLAAFLNSVPAAPPLSEPPKSSGLLLPVEAEPTVDPLLRNEAGDAIELNECTVEWLSGEEEVKRIIELCSTLLLKQANPAGPGGTPGAGEDDCDYYGVLKVPILASMDLIKRHYKKLSVLIHPDKCSHAAAPEAFHCLNTAYKELQKPQYRLRFRSRLAEAREKLKQDIAEINKKRKKGEKVEAEWYSSDTTEQIVYDENDPRILNRLLQVSEELQQEIKQRLEYAEQVRKANLMYEIMMHEQKEAALYKEDLEIKEWKKRQDERVVGWREFRDSSAIKKSRVVRTETVLDHTSRKKARHS